MQIKWTKSQKSCRKEPTMLAVLQELEQRKALEHHPPLKNKLRKLARGHDGEEILMDYLKVYGKKHWTVLRNVWLNFFGGFECDVLVVTKAGLYPFEVKNYTHTFYLEDNIGKINGVELSKHPLAQGQNAVISLEAIFKHSPMPPKVNGSVLFVGADSNVVIQDEVKYVNVLLRNELKEFILQMGKTESTYRGPQIHLQTILNTLAPHEIQNPFPAVNLYAEFKQQIQVGIICCHCGSGVLDISKKYVACACGMHEPRDEAIVRTICEYGVLNFDRDLTVTELVDFFGGQISRSNVARVINQYFEKQGSFRNAEVVNPKLPFPEIYHQFEFPNKKFKVISGPKLE